MKSTFKQIGIKYHVIWISHIYRMLKYRKYQNKSSHTVNVYAYWGSCKKSLKSNISIWIITNICRNASLAHVYQNVKYLTWGKETLFVVMTHILTAKQRQVYSLWKCDGSVETVVGFQVYISSRNSRYTHIILPGRCMSGVDWSSWMANLFVNVYACADGHWCVSSHW